MFLLKLVLTLLGIFLAYQLLMMGANWDLFEGFALVEIFQQEGGGLFALFLIGLAVALMGFGIKFLSRRTR